MLCKYSKKVFLFHKPFIARVSIVFALYKIRFSFWSLLISFFLSNISLSKLELEPRHSWCGNDYCTRHVIFSTIFKAIWRNFFFPTILLCRMLQLSSFIIFLPKVILYKVFYKCLNVTQNSHKKVQKVHEFCPVRPKPAEISNSVS